MNTVLGISTPTLAAFGMLIVGVCANASASDTTRIDRVVVSIPAPVGYVNVDLTEPYTAKQVALMGAGVNRVLTLAYREADLRLSEKGRDVYFNRFSVAQTSLRSEKLTVSIQQFHELRKTVRDDFAKHLRAAERHADKITSKKRTEIAQLYGEPTALAIGDTRQLEVFDDTDISIGTLAIATRIAETPGRRVEETIVLSVAMVLVKGKILNLSVHSPYTTRHDVELVRQTSLQWINKIKASN